MISNFPIKHEIVLTYITSRYHGNHPIMSTLKRRVRGDVLSLDWLEKWNPDSMEIIIDKYRESTVTNINSILDTMEEIEKDQLIEWNMDELLNSNKYQTIQAELTGMLE